MEIIIQCGTWGSDVNAHCMLLVVGLSSLFPTPWNQHTWLPLLLNGARQMCRLLTHRMSTQGILWIPARCSDSIVKMPGLEEEVKELIYFVIDLTLTALKKCRNCFITGKSNHNKKHKLVAVELSLPLSLLECLPSSPETHSTHQGVFLLTSLLTASAC